MKACNQIVVALVIEAVAEALVLGSKAGVAPHKVIEVLGRGPRGQQGSGGQRREILVARLHPRGARLSTTARTWG